MQNGISPPTHVPARPGDRDYYFVKIEKAFPAPDLALELEMRRAAKKLDGPVRVYSSSESDRAWFYVFVTA